jgi:hypothetical protein
LAQLNSNTDIDEASTAKEFGAKGLSFKQGTEFNQTLSEV